MPNISRLGRIKDTAFGANVSNKIVLNARVTGFQLLRETQQGEEVKLAGWFGSSDALNEIIECTQMKRAVAKHEQSALAI